MREFNRITSKNQVENQKKSVFSLKTIGFLTIFPKYRGVRNEKCGQMVNVILPIKFKQRDARDPFIGQCKMMQIDHLLRIRKMLHEEDLEIRDKLTRIDLRDDEILGWR